MTDQVERPELMLVRSVIVKGKHLGNIDTTAPEHISTTENVQNLSTSPDENEETEIMWMEFDSTYLVTH